MLQKVRKGVWETNSSSVHSLVMNDSITEELQESYIRKSLPLNRNKILKLEGGEYGWGYDYLKRPLEKVNYLAVLLLQYFPEEHNISMFEEVLKELSGAVDIQYTFINSEGQESGDCYIDGQSLDISPWEPLFKSKETLKDFILSCKYNIEISNDNM